MDVDETVFPYGRLETKPPTSVCNFPAEIVFTWACLSVLKSTNTYPMMSHRGYNSWFLFWLWPHKPVRQAGRTWFSGNSVIINREEPHSLGQPPIQYNTKKGDRFRLRRSRVHIPDAPRRTTRRPLVVSGHATEGSWLVKRDWPEQLRFFSIVLMWMSFSTTRKNVKTFTGMMGRLLCFLALFKWTVISFAKWKNTIVSA